MQRAIVYAVAAVALCAAACGPRPGGTSTQPTQIHNVLSEAELQNAKERTLYEVVQHLRPAFYRSRQVRSSSTPNPEPVHVFIDGTRADGIEALKLLPPSQVREVRFYEPQDANVRFGTGHNGGLISVTTIR